MFSSKEHIPLILCSTRPVTVCFGNGLFAIRYSQSQAIEQIRVALFDEVVTLQPNSFFCEPSKSV